MLPRGTTTYPRPEWDDQEGKVSFKHYEANYTPIRLPSAERRRRRAVEAAKSASPANRKELTGQAFAPIAALAEEPDLSPADPQAEEKRAVMRNLDDLAKPDKYTTAQMKDLLHKLHTQETSLNLLDQLSMASPMIRAAKVVPNIIPPVECEHYYGLLRKCEEDEVSGAVVRENIMKDSERRSLRNKAWATLEYLMTTLMLGGEFDIVRDGNKAKERSDAAKLADGKLTGAQFDNR